MSSMLTIILIDMQVYYKMAFESSTYSVYYVKDLYIVHNCSAF